MAEGARTPPHNLEAETSLLGAMLLSRDAIAAAVEADLRPEDFYSPAHGHVFAAITALYSRGAPSDPVTVADELGRAGVLGQVGGGAVLLSLQAGTPSTGNAARYARIVADRSTLRRYIETSRRVADLAYDVPEDVSAFCDEAERLVFDVRPEREVPDSSSLADSLEEWLDALEAKSAAGGVVQHSTGIPDLDEAIDGLEPSRVVVVGASTGAGKTSFGLALAGKVALRGEPVVYVSIEMSRRELVNRIVATETGLNSQWLNRGRIADPDWARISAAMTRLGPLPIEIVDIASATVHSIRAAVRRAMARYGRVGPVIIDFVQLMAGAGARPENRQVELATVCRDLKVLSREMGVCVVELSQVSRNIEQRQDKRPILADLRETGGLEINADQVVMIYREEHYNPSSTDAGVAELLIRKNRHGAQGMVRVGADLATGRWSGLSKREEI